MIFWFSLFLKSDLVGSGNVHFQGLRLKWFTRSNWVINIKSSALKLPWSAARWHLTEDFRTFWKFGCFVASTFDRQKRKVGNPHFTQRLTRKAKGRNSLVIAGTDIVSWTKINFVNFSINQWHAIFDLWFLHVKIWSDKTFQFQSKTT